MIISWDAVAQLASIVPGVSSDLVVDQSRDNPCNSSLVCDLGRDWCLRSVATGLLSGSSTNCAKVSTTVVTILAGPLNYLGANPKIQCEVPQPSE